MQCKTVHDYWSGIYRQKKISPALQDSSLLLNVMIKPNTENSNSQLLATQKSPSNAPLFLHLPPTLSTNSFNLLLSTQLDSHLLSNFLSIHLDYLRVSISELTKLSLTRLKNYLFSGLNTRTINKPWHPYSEIPKSQKYDYRIVSKAGIALAVKKRAKYKGKNTRYVYDVMIDYTGAYFADLSLLEQFELIYCLNANYKLKCHRIDVAIDDYSRELFPLLQMVVAVEMKNCFGFTESNQDYLYCRSEGCIGTLALGSRRSEHYVRIYTVHKFFDRWEAELKQGKSQSLFNNLAAFSIDKLPDKHQIEKLLKTLVLAAFYDKDFRDKTSISSQKNATKARTKRLLFWSDSLSKIFLSVGIKSIDKA